jgi:ankyrin repeat protein
MGQNEKLILAAQEGDAQTLKALLEAGVDVNAKAHAGMTALMHATKNKHGECVKVLIKAGADVNAVNELGRTALKMAEEKGFQDITKLLKDAGAVGKPKIETSLRQDEAKKPEALWRIGLPLAFVVIVIAFVIQMGFDGPSFLAFYVLLFIVTFASSHAIRKAIDTDEVNYLALLVFEGVGVIRIFYGATHGMHKFGFLIIGMIIGGIILLRPNIIESSGNSGSDGFFSSSSSSSCGGGCGGSCGGGCGGCGD